MQIIPAIDIKGGKCVRLTKGDYSRETIYEHDPMIMAKKWKEQGATFIHIVDLDGAKEGKPVNIETIKQIIEKVNIPVQVGGGIRSFETAKTLIDNDVNRIILSTVALENAELLKKLLKEYKEKIIVSLDAKNGKLMKKGWLEGTDMDVSSTISQLELLGLETIIYTDTSRDGTLEGPNFEEIENVRKQTKCRLIIAGGLSSISDIKKLKELNVDGVILGKSLYEGKIDLKEAINVG